MAKNVLLLWFSVLLCAAQPAFAEDDSAQLIRALQLKRSDTVVVLEPDPFIAPRIADRVRVIVNAEDPAVAPHTVDVVVLYDALHGAEHRAELYSKIRRLLRAGGRVVHIDLSAKFPEAQAAQEFTAAGFHITKTVGLLPLQYFQVFE
jgi:SAM-dependent methyltransferase